MNQVPSIPLIYGAQVPENKNSVDLKNRYSKTGCKIFKKQLEGRLGESSR